MRDSNITPQFVEDMVDRVIDQLTNKLEQLDISLDYIAALLAGIPAGDIGTRQARAGRSATDIPLAMKNLKESKKMKLTKAKLKQIIKEELEAIKGTGAGLVPMGVDFQLDPRVRRGTKLFWYETADGTPMIPLVVGGVSRQHDEGVEEVSAKVIRVIPRGINPDTGHSRGGPFVLVQVERSEERAFELGEPDSTIELDGHWFESVFIK